MTTATKPPAPVVLREINGEPIERIVLENRQQFRETIDRLLDDGTRLIVLDLSACEYIDSSGFGVLVTSAKKLRDRGGLLVLAALTTDVKSLLKLTKLDELFVIADSTERAIEFLEGPRA